MKRYPDTCFQFSTSAVAAPSTVESLSVRHWNSARLPLLHWILLLFLACAFTPNLIFAQGVITFDLIKSGTGSGRVVSDPPGIDCGTDCSAIFDHNVHLTFTVTPDAGSSFAGWAGADDCADFMVVDFDTICTIIFNLNGEPTTPTLTVEKAGTGNGTVTSSPEGIDCGSDCSESYQSGTEVTLTAAPAADSAFDGWSGASDCADGVVTLDSNTTCTATFNLQGEPAFYLPHVANGQFDGGSIRTTFVLFNTTSREVSVVLRLTQDDSSPLKVTIPELGTDKDQFALSLDLGETRIFQTDGSGDVATGAATVTASDAIGISAIFSIFDAAGNFLTEAGVGSSAALTDFVVPVDSTGFFDTGLALFNPGSDAALVEFQLLDESGQEFSSTDINVDGSGHVAKFIIGDLFPGAADFRGSLVVSSTRPIAALTLRQHASPLSFTTLPVVSRTTSQSQFSLPHVANGQFDGGSIGMTFVLFNVSSSQATVDLFLTLDNGSPFEVTIPGMGTNSTFRVELEPGETRFLQTDASGPLASGAARLDSDVPVGVAAIFSIFDTQGQFVTETGVGGRCFLGNIYSASG